MAYAGLTDVANILPPDEDMPEADSRAETNLLTALEEATDLVIGFLDREYTGTPDDDGVPEDVPDPVRRVVARVAMRGFLNEDAQQGAESEVQLMGPFSHTINWMKEVQARDFFLTRSDEIRLERFKLFPTTGAAHVAMAGASDWVHRSYRHRRRWW